jgi:hypothetical protein
MAFRSPATVDGAAAAAIAAGSCQGRRSADTTPLREIEAPTLSVDRRAEPHGAARDGTPRGPLRRRRRTRVRARIDLLDDAVLSVRDPQRLHRTRRRAQLALRRRWWSPDHRRDRRARCCRKAMALHDRASAERRSASGACPTAYWRRSPLRGRCIWSSPPRAGPGRLSRSSCGPRAPPPGNPLPWPRTAAGAAPWNLGNRRAGQRRDPDPGAGSHR